MSNIKQAVQKLREDTKKGELLQFLKEILAYNIKNEKLELPDKWVIKYDKYRKALDVEDLTAYYNTIAAFLIQKVQTVKDFTEIDMNVIQWKVIALSIDLDIEERCKNEQRKREEV